MNVVRAAGVRQGQDLARQAANAVHGFAVRCIRCKATHTDPQPPSRPGVSAPGVADAATGAQSDTYSSRGAKTGMGIAVDWYAESQSKMRVFKKLLHS